MMSPFCKTRPDGLGLPKIIAGLAIGVEPMIRKSMSPPPSRMAAPAAARSSYSVTPGLARAAIASMARWQRRPALRTQSSSSALWIDKSSCIQPCVAQDVVLIDRQVVAVARIDLEQSDAAALELELLETLDHHLGVAAA